jgi:hypothetical protein
MIADWGPLVKMTYVGAFMVLKFIPIELASGAMAWSVDQIILVETRNSAVGMEGDYQSVVFV